MRHARQLSIAGVLIAGTLAPAPPHAAHAAGPAATATATARVSIDGVGLIPAKSDHYTNVLRVKEYGAFVALYHTTYRGGLKAHVSVDRNSRTIYRAAMSSTTKGRTYFYVWSQFRNGAQAGRLVAYLTIQAGSTKVTKELPFTLVR